MWLKLLLFNSPPAICGLGYHGVWIKAPPFLQVVKELPLHNYFKLNFYLCHPKSISAPLQAPSPSSSWLRSSSYHHMNLLNPGILYAPVHSSYMGRFRIYSENIACRPQMNSFVGHSPAASKASSTDYHSNPPSLYFKYKIRDILQSTQWCNPSITFSIAYATTQLSLQ